MGTRGVFGVRINETDKLGYNHFDSYPECLGVSIVKDLGDMLRRENGLVQTCKEAAMLQVIDEDGPVTPEMKEKLKDFADTTVQDGSLDNRYVLMRGLQGELKKTLEVGYILDNAAFIADSLFCEWGYIANFDTEMLEIYRGFQKSKPKRGRYQTKAPDWKNSAGETIRQEYWPCELIGEIPFDYVAWELDKPDLSVKDFMPLCDGFNEDGEEIDEEAAA